jgi:hypothetical protein
MTRNQRRKKIAKFREKKNRRGFSFKKLLFLLFVIFGITFYVWATSRAFAKNSKLTVVVGGGEQVTISTFDRERGTISNLTIPESTQVSVSRQLGSWPAESVWRLGQNEGLNGTLLAETILKNFKIPVVAWADGNYLKFAWSKTNLGVGDRLRLAIFSWGVAPSRKTNIDLGTFGILKKTRLVGGEEGFLVNDNIPESLYYLFADPKINSANLRIEVQNKAINRNGAEVVTGVLEVLGGKVAAISNKESKEFLCEVSGRDKQIVSKIASIFGCETTTFDKSENFDLTIIIGEEFAKRY